MSHEISIRADGQQEMMYTGEKPWHMLGNHIENAPNSAEAFKAALLDWEVSKQDIYVKGIGDSGENIYRVVKDKVATVREDTGAVLGIVSKNYEVFQNASAFEFTDKLIGTGEVKYEAAGALKGGKIIWLLARLNTEPDKIVDGDVLNRYLLMFSSHDGSSAITILPTSVRVICFNTLNLAAPGLVGTDERKAGSSSRKGLLRIKHSQNVKFQLEDARKLLGICNGKFVEFNETARKLAQVKITQAQFEEFVETLIPTPQTGKMPPQRQKVRERIAHIYHNGKEQEMCRGTGWCALNSITHFIDHDFKGKGRTDGARMSNTLYSRWFGQAGGFKQEAAKLAVDMFVNS